MTQAANPVRQTFAYRGQSYDGKPIEGTIEALDLAEATRLLGAMNLRVLRLDPAAAAVRAKPLGRDDFMAFNQQLAWLVGAGLPIEQGLRLIAEEMRSNRTAQSIREVAAELERGVPLGEAFKHHERQFPALYGTIIEAGVRSGNLSAVLLSLGRHLDLVARLRAILWRAAAYPLAVLAGVLFVLIFLSLYVFPQFQAIYEDMNVSLPVLTQGLLTFSKWVPWIIAGGILLFVGAPMLHWLLRLARLEQAAADLLLPLPLIGTMLRRNLIARWSDAMKLAVVGGMDLPAAFDHSARVIGSPALRRDSSRVVDELKQGHPVDQTKRLSILPAAALTVVQIASERGDLPDALAALSDLYEQQAQTHLVTIQTLVSPALILAVAILVGFVIVALFAPMISLIRSISG